MIIAFPVIFGVESIWPDVTTFAAVSHIASHFWGNPLVWFTMMFTLAQVSIGEIIYGFMKQEDNAIDRAIYVQSVIREQINANSD